jgi:beta-carotene ketolase (CrtW type)
LYLRSYIKKCKVIAVAVANTICLAQDSLFMHHSSLSHSPSSYQDSVLGLVTALIIIVLSLVSLVVLFQGDVTQLGIVGILMGVLIRTFLHTGLFITAHDAMHGTVFSANRRLNDWIGTLATRFYALLPYRQLHRKHQQHHRYSGKELDPDYSVEAEGNFALWYFHFMRGYLDGRQLWVLLIGMTIIFNSLWLGFGVAIANIFLFWVIPIILSSLQLFYFGTYLPHRPTPDGYPDTHRARSNYLPVLWSFLSCYHFGYHWEHHQYPQIPWYHLPKAVKISVSN